MALLPRLLKVGSITGSLGVYVPAVVAQKCLGMFRVLLLTHLLTRADYGLWGLGAMTFNLLALVVTLGSTEGLVRYVSYYEIRGRLEEFRRRTGWAILAAGLVLTAVAALASPLITRLAFSSRAEVANVPYDAKLSVCLAAVANGLLLALYQNTVAFLVGMRTYRLVAAIELLFGAVFTALALSAVALRPTALALLLGHLGALVVSLAVGLLAVRLAVGALARPAAERRAAAPEAPQLALMEAPFDPDEVMQVQPAGQPQKPGAPTGPGMLHKVFRFGSVSFFAGVSWMAVAYVSFLVTNRRLGEAQAGVFYAFWMLSQPLLALANAAWVVIFTHAAKRWESDDRGNAMFVLEMSYKAVAVGMMTLTVLVYLGAPLWVRLVAGPFREGRDLLSGLLMFFQMTNHLALMMMLAKLHERPYAIAVTAWVAGTANLLLATWWVTARGAAGAAYAAGVGMYLGGGAVTLMYFLLTRTRFRAGTYGVLLSPILLLLPPWASGAAWAGVILTALRTRWCFSDREKDLLRRALGNLRQALPKGSAR